MKPYSKTLTVGRQSTTITVLVNETGRVMVEHNGITHSYCANSLLAEKLRAVEAEEIAILAANEQRCIASETVLATLGYAAD